jgi:7-cyano-7-deazaguanine synthase
MKKAVISFSGGLDSSTLLYIAKEREFEIHALSFDYGQRNLLELDLAQSLTSELNIKSHKILKIDNGTFSGSALTDDIEVPKDRGKDILSGDIPITYVPARNTVFLAHSLALAETLNARDIFIGVNALDYSGYPDCRPEFIKAFEKVANLGTKASLPGATPYKIHTPLINMTKAEIISKGIALGVDYAKTLSCYDPDEEARACGHCDTCILRQKGFDEAGVKDPTPYQ